MRRASARVLSINNCTVLRKYQKQATDQKAACFVCVVFLSKLYDFVSIVNFFNSFTSFRVLNVALLFHSDGDA